MSLIAGVILDHAAKLSVPLIKKILTNRLGGENAELATTVIDAIADRAGVSPAQIPDVAKTSPSVLEAAIKQTEPEAADLLEHHVESQRISAELQKAEMDKGPLWTWAWRPAWMYLLGVFWIWAIIIAPLANAYAIAIPMTDVGSLFGLTGAYLALYMGGHTIKKVAENR